MAAPLSSPGRNPVRVQGLEGRLLVVQSAKALVVGAGTRQSPASGQGRDSPVMGSKGARRLLWSGGSTGGREGLPWSGDATGATHPLPSGRTVSPSMACTPFQLTIQDSTKRAGLCGIIACNGTIPVADDHRMRPVAPIERQPSRTRSTSQIIPQVAGGKAIHFDACPGNSTSRASLSICASRVEPPVSGCSFCMRRFHAARMSSVVAPSASPRMASASARLI